MADNKCVVYVEPGKVAVQGIEYPKLEIPAGVPGNTPKLTWGDPQSRRHKYLWE